MDVKKCIVLFSLLMLFVGCEDNFDPDQWKGTNISGGYSGRMTLLVDGYNWECRAMLHLCRWDFILLEIEQ